MLLDVLQTCKQCLTVFGSRYYDFFLIINNQRRLPHGFLWLVNNNYAATRYQGPIQKFAEGLRFLLGFVLTRYIQEQLPSFFNKTYLYSYSYSIEYLEVDTKSSLSCQNDLDLPIEIEDIYYPGIQTDNHRNECHWKNWS